MALKDTWIDLEDAVQGVGDSGSDISVTPINKIAHAVIDLEEVDDAISDTSTNPVQNKVVKEYVDEEVAKKQDEAFVVDITLSSDDEKTIVTSEITYEQIKEAVDNGKTVVGKAYDSINNRTVISSDLLALPDDKAYCFSASAFKENTPYDYMYYLFCMCDENNQTTWALKATSPADYELVEKLYNDVQNLKSEVSNMDRWTALCDTDPTAESTNMLVSTWNIDIDNFTELMIQLYVPKDSDTTVRALQVVLIENEDKIPTYFQDANTGVLFVSAGGGVGNAVPSMNTTYLFESRFFDNGRLIKTEYSHSYGGSHGYPQHDWAAVGIYTKAENPATYCSIKGKRGIAIKYNTDTLIFPAGTVLRVFGR